MQLSMNKSATKELMEAYYIEKMDEQDRYASQEFGVLSVRVYYNHEAEILSVEGKLWLCTSHCCKNWCPPPPHVQVI